MALLQISEPGLSAAPHQRRLAAGIDLGTTNSLVATVRSGQAETLADHEGRHLLPSVVHYQQQGHSVGYDARTNAALDTANTISSVKRLMGRSLADIQQRYPHLPYQFQASENGLPMIETAAGLLNPVRVSADILKALAARATEALAGELDGVVITVPAYFDDAQRQGTKDAARLAGLHVLRFNKILDLCETQPVDFRHSMRSSNSRSPSSKHLRPKPVQAIPGKRPWPS